MSGVVGFQDRTEGQVKKHSGPICWIKQRRERERERSKENKKKNDREERGERENLSCLSLLL